VKKILMICTALLLTVGLVGAGTFAFFFDTETTGPNTFAAGTLDLVVTGGPATLPAGPPSGLAWWTGVAGQQAVFLTLTNIAPGNTGNATFNIQNVGSLNGFLDILNVTVVNDAGLTPEPEPLPDAGELGAHLWVNVTIGDELVLPKQPVGKLHMRTVDWNRPLAAGTTINPVIHWSLPRTVGNIVQGDIVKITFIFRLDQFA
jgi:predicted ribosomally synthesized peptide with SipW-like signal peptide